MQQAPANKMFPARYVARYPTAAPALEREEAACDVLTRAQEAHAQAPSEATEATLVDARLAHREAKLAYLNAERRDVRAHKSELPDGLRETVEQLLPETVPELKQRR